MVEGYRVTMPSGGSIRVGHKLCIVVVRDREPQVKQITWIANICYGMVFILIAIKVKSILLILVRVVQHIRGNV